MPLIMVVAFLSCFLMMWPIVMQQTQRIEKIQATTATQEARKQMVDDYRATEVAKINPEASKTEGVNLDFLSNIPTVVYLLVIAAIVGLVMRSGGTVER